MGIGVCTPLYCIPCTACHVVSGVAWSGRMCYMGYRTTSQKGRCGIGTWDSMGFQTPRPRIRPSGAPYIQPLNPYIQPRSTWCSMACMVCHYTLYGSPHGRGDVLVVSCALLVVHRSLMHSMTCPWTRRMRMQIGPNGGVSHAPEATPDTPIPYNQG